MNNPLKKAQAFWLMLFSCVAAFSVGCSTLRHEDYEQKVLIRSQPSGAMIEFDGKRWGRTPNYITVRRSRDDKKFSLIWKDQSKISVDLKSRYDWSGSFVSNLVFLSLAPIGWGVDYLTDTAFRYEKPTKIRKPGYGRPVTMLAIAPPLAPDEYISDSVAARMVNEAERQFDKAQVISYRVTLNQFIEHGIDFDSGSDPENQRDSALAMKADFDVSHVLFSQAEVKGDSVRVKGELLDADTGTQSTKIDWVLDSDGIQVMDERSWMKKWGDVIHLLPNAISFDYGSDKPELAFEDVKIEGESQKVSGVWGDVSQVVGSIGMQHFDPPTWRRKWRFRFQWVPGVNFRYGGVQFPKLSGVENADFERLTLFAGMGPQFSFLSRYGHIYLTYILGPRYQYIHWNEEGQTGSADSITVSRGYELGYLYFVNRNWYIKLFSNYLDEDVKLWQEAITATGGPPNIIKSSGTGRAGVSVGYYFPDHSHPARWAIKDNQ